MALDYVIALFVWIFEGVKTIGTLYNRIPDRTKVGQYHVRGGK